MNIKLFKLGRSRKIKVGIPRALYYYKFRPLWETFFREVGAQVTVSAPTSKTIKDIGVKGAPDEDCYNSKLFYGHFLSLKDKVDCFFVPRLGSDHPVHVGCPKFISLADVIRAMYPGLPPILRPYYSQAKAGHGKVHFVAKAFDLGLNFTLNPFKIFRAIARAVKAQREYKKSLWLSLDDLTAWKTGDLALNDPPDVSELGGGPPLKIALAAHSYVMNDAYACLDIKKKLAAHGVSVITSEQMPREIVQEQMDKLDYNFYFEYEREILGTILYFIEDKSVDGIIHINTFSCGPDSIAGEMASQYSKRDPEVPLLQLVFDELTGEAGLNTRIEAFTDMLKRRRKKTPCRLPTPTLEA